MGELVHSQGRQLQSELLLHPSEKGSSLKGKNLPQMGADSFLLEKTPFSRDLACRKANRKSQKVVSLVKMVENISRVSSLLIISKCSDFATEKGWKLNY